MITKYFAGIRFSPSETYRNFWVIDYGGHTYYATAYSSRKSGKTQLSKTLVSLGTSPLYVKGDFDFHHIVEKEHLADISFAGDDIGIIYGSMPTIMVHESEHDRFSRSLDVGETRKLYMRTDTYERIGAENREKLVRQMFSTSDTTKREAAKKEINTRIDIMQQLYNQTYNDNKLLKTVASNIFRDYRTKLAGM